MKLTIDNTTQSLEEWALDYGIPCSLIRSRLRRGWNEERAVTEPMPVSRGQKLEIDAMHDLPPALHTAELGPPPLPPRRTMACPGDQIRERRVYKVRGFTHDGKTMSVRQWAEHLGISVQAMHVRLKTKSGADAFAPPLEGWIKRRS